MRKYLPKLRLQFAMLIVKPEAVEFTSVIEKYLKQRDFDVVRTYKLTLPEDELGLIYSKIQNPNWTGLPQYLHHMTSDKSVVMFLFYESYALDVQAELKSLIGSTNPERAGRNTLRHALTDLICEKYGRIYEEDGDFFLNGVHVADDKERAAYEALVLFGEDIRNFLSE